MQKKIGKTIKRYLFDPVLDLFFPPLCCICDCYLPPDHKTICENCWSEIPEFDGIFDQSLRNKSFNDLFILFQFEEKIRQLIHLLKQKKGSLFSIMEITMKLFRFLSIKPEKESVDIIRVKKLQRPCHIFFRSPLKANIYCVLALLYLKRKCPKKKENKT